MKTPVVELKGGSSLPGEARLTSEVASVNGRADARIIPDSGPHASPVSAEREGQDRRREEVNSRAESAGGSGTGRCLPASSIVRLTRGWRNGAVP